MAKHYSLRELADFLGAELIGDDRHLIFGLATLQDADSKSLSFLDNAKYQAFLADTQAGAVILAKKDLPLCKTSALVVNEPYLAYAKVAQLFWQKEKPSFTIHPTALLDHSVKLGANVSIGPYAVIGKNCTIADNSIIGAHCILGNHCHIGAASELMPRVTLYDHVEIGAHCIIHSGVVLGSDGFGFAPGPNGFEKIPQLGGVTIKDHVEIGANTTIDRGALSNTIINEGVKLDNQIQIGHNVKIGAHTVIAGCAGIAGSVDIGSHCMIGGGVGIAGHIKITDNVMLTGMTGVPQSIEEPGVYSSGTGLLPRREWHKAIIRFRQLNELAKTVQELAKQK